MVNLLNSPYEMLSDAYKRQWDAEANHESASGLDAWGGGWANFIPFMQEAGYSGGGYRVDPMTDMPIFDPQMQSWIDNNMVREGSESYIPRDYSGFFTEQGYDIGRRDMGDWTWEERVFRDGKPTDVSRRISQDDMDFYNAAMLMLSIAGGGAAAAGLGSMGGSIGSGLGFSGPMANAVGNGLMNTVGGAVVGGKEGAMNGLASFGKSLAGSYASSGLQGSSYMPSSGYAIEPGFFDSGADGYGGSSMFDYFDYVPTDFSGGTNWGNFDFGSLNQGSGGNVLDLWGGFDLGGGIPAGGGTGGGSVGGSGSGVPWGQLANIGGNLLSTYLQQRGVNQANRAVQQGLDRSDATLRYMYDQTRADNLPALAARNAGLIGYTNLLADPSKITQDPGYQFGLREAQGAADRRAAAAGNYYSGQQLKEATDRAQEYATSKFDNALNRFGNMAGLGQVGAGTIAQAGQNYGNASSQNALTGGMNRGAASTARNNLWANSINDLISYGNKNIWGG